MGDFWKNLSVITRPLSNVKNILIASLAFFLSGTKINWFYFILGILSVSFISSASYVMNSFYDFKIDKDNNNKKHYLKAIIFFGKRKIGFIFWAFSILGLLLGLLINYYFFFSIILLLFLNFLYSSPITRFKEKIILDVLIAGFSTFALRFIAFWFVFNLFFPPILPVLALIFAKSGGYLTYKEMDREFLENQKIKNSTTFFSKKTIIIISGFFYFLSVFFYILMCFNGQLPFNFIFLAPFALLPVIITYLKIFDKIKAKGKVLRIFGLLYGLGILILALILY